MRLQLLKGNKMSERRYTVAIIDKNKIKFEGFWKFLNPHKYYKKIEDDFIELYSDLSEKGIKKLKEQTKIKFQNAIISGEFISSDWFDDRAIGWGLAQYIATKGIPICIEDIGGWNPEVIILNKNADIVKKYLKNPDLNFDERFSYLDYWAEEVGLTPEK